MGMSSIKTSFGLILPAWIKNEVPLLTGYDTDEKKMALAVGLARKNVENSTGGPFGAAVFVKGSGELVSVGVNAVVAGNCSVAHAEIIAIMLAQRSRSVCRLGGKGRPVFVLVSSAQPCAMCFGALLWSGVKELISGARRKDVERITGFDEGPLYRRWKEELKRRGIRLKENVLRQESCSVLEHYKATGGILY
jgi:tRNA(Arg) A34 adenosine deaminase TadA